MKPNDCGVHNTSYSNSYTQNMRMLTISMGEINISLPRGFQSVRRRFQGFATYFKKVAILSRIIQGLVLSTYTFGKSVTFVI
jgi:hypothetical protein